MKFLESEFRLVSDQVTLVYDMRWGIVGGSDRRLLLAPDATQGDVVKAAMKLAADHQQGEQTSVKSFSAYRSVVGQIGGHVLKSDTPIEVLPRSYFGRVTKLSRQFHKQRGYRNFKHAVDTDSGEWEPLAPGNRVYDKLTGQLIHSEPT